MPYDVALEYRIDTQLAGRGVALEKKRMFGGICYLVNGNIAFGVRKDELLVRVSDTDGKKLLQQPSVRHFEMGQRVAMKNWYLAGGEAIAEDAELAKLLELGLEYAESLPKKS